jgi:hypothetical protein
MTTEGTQGLDSARPRKHRLQKLLLGVASGTVLAIAVPSFAAADLQLATFGCSDGSSFQVSADTDTLNMLTNAVTNINTEDLGLSCSIQVDVPPPPPILFAAPVLAGNQTSVYAVGGGVNDANVHFAFSAHLDPDTNTFKGSAVIQPENADRIKGDVSCYQSGGTRSAVVGINVQNSDGTTTTLVFQTQDTGSGGNTPPDHTQIWQINSDEKTCDGPRDPQNTVVKGNVVVRP